MAAAAPSLAVRDIDEFIFGRAPRPVRCGRGVEIGAGIVVPEVNFTLPAMDINPDTWADVRQQYAAIIKGVTERAAALEVPALLVEFEALPPMTVHPQWGLEITRILADGLDRAQQTTGLKGALRFTPNDSRDHERPPRMRSGPYWDGMLYTFQNAAAAGADLLAIESTGGKEICDQALMNADLRTMVFALGVLAPRDMHFLWTAMVDACRAGGIVPSGDTACGFANTAMVLAEQKMLPRVFAAAVRVASVPRGLVAYEVGALGPGKDCGYENPYMKAIMGVPISMEGRTAACAHLSTVGNIAQAVCDCWSNESVQNVRLLSAEAPVVSTEQLAYDCRLMNLLASRSSADVRTLRDWLVDTDAALDPQAWVLKPEVVLKLAGEIAQETEPYARTRRGVQAAIAEIRRARESGELRVAANELRWLDRIAREADSLPASVDEFTQDMLADLKDAPWLPGEYGLGS